ncbi:unnamed protein product [Leptosia nina]|uniref:RRM domain-containing protein n=1 Tax=Leptosia nina TaxID=320188 RepID=A0AAV1JA20_9NEOP
MEESVALDTSKQKDFVKSVKGIKKVLNKKKKQHEEATKNIEKGVQDGKIKKRRPRGLVYLSHIPHGFYEHQMQQYFSQFGLVTNVRVIRSKRTGNSKGYAFVEFRDTTVAQVVAETMNNYLMGKRLIKAQYIPPKKQRRNAKRHTWTPENNPTANRRREEKKKINKTKSDVENLQAAKNLLKTLNKTKSKLKAMGIDYDFFKPVDIPAGLQLNQEIPEVKEEKKPDIKKEESKDDKKQIKQVDVDSNTSSKKKRKSSAKDGKDINKIVEEVVIKKSKVKKDATVEEIAKPILKKAKKNKSEKLLKQKSHVEMQKKSKQKSEDISVQTLEDFIRLEHQSDDDSDDDFNSDEFEKAVGEDSLDSGGDKSDGDTSEVESPKMLKAKKQKRVKRVVQQAPPVETLNEKKKKQTKPPQTPTVSDPIQIAEKKPIPSKKAKFEKQKNKKTLNKVIKKKK